jgi:hypothetical protein
MKEESLTLVGRCNLKPVLIAHDIRAWNQNMVNCFQMLLSINACAAIPRPLISRLRT